MILGVRRDLLFIDETLTHHFSRPSVLQVLKFDAYFQEDVPMSTEEHYRIRQVHIYYYLEDDSMSVIEPVVENFGIPQGKLIKRQRLSKNDRGDHYHWKDLNRGINITIYGKTFRIVDCDKFTQV